MFNLQGVYKSEIKFYLVNDVCARTHFVLQNRGKIIQCRFVPIQFTIRFQIRKLEFHFKKNHILDG